MSKLITNVQYRVEWSYPSSPNAVDMGFSKTGCWTVERTATINGKLEEKPIRGYANRIEACAYVDTLLKCPTTDSIPSPATLSQPQPQNSSCGHPDARASGLKHTPLPWMASGCFIHTKTQVIAEAGNLENNANANAEFIVRAVNAHDELVAACKQVLSCAETDIDANDIDWNGLRAAVAVRNYGEAADIFQLDDATDKLLKAIEQEAIEQ